MWTPEIIRARFVEACDTARRFPPAGMSTKTGYWPEYMHTFEEMLSWGTQRLAEDRAFRIKRAPPSASAISRHDEVVNWAANFIADERHRRIVWAWAWCRMSGTSFAQRCHDNGWVRITAYRRLGVAMDRICAKLHNRGALLRLPDEKWLIQEQQPDVSSGPTLDEVTVEQPTPTFHIFPGPKPVDMLTTPKAIKAFERFLSETNSARRAEQERRKRKLLGCEEDAA